MAVWVAGGLLIGVVVVAPLVAVAEWHWWAAVLLAVAEATLLIAGLIWWEDHDAL